MLHKTFEINHQTTLTKILVWIGAWKKSYIEYNLIEERKRYIYRILFGGCSMTFFQTERTRAVGQPTYLMRIFLFCGRVMLHKYVRLDFEGISHVGS